MAMAKKEVEEVKELLDQKEKILHMKNKGISVLRAEFRHAVNNADDVPEHNFSTTSPTKNRKAQMWWISCDGLLCFQNNKYFFVPSALVKFVKFE